MIRTIYIILSILGLGYCTFVITGVLKGNLSFGHGLGDLYYLGGIIIFSLVILLGLILVKKLNKQLKNISEVFLIGAIVIFISLSFLKLTIFRGVENSWDGNVMINNEVPDDLFESEGESLEDIKKRRHKQP